MNDQEFTEAILYLAERASDYAKFNEIVSQLEIEE